MIVVLRDEDRVIDSQLFFLNASSICFLVFHVVLREQLLFFLRGLQSEYRWQAYVDRVLQGIDCGGGWICMTYCMEPPL